MKNKHLEALYKSIQMRMRPEDVADRILKVLKGKLLRNQRATLAVAAKGSLRRTLSNYSSMMANFQRPKSLENPINKAQELFVDAPKAEALLYHDPKAALSYVQVLGAEIKKELGKNNFLADRKNRVARKYAGLDLSKRQYNKRFRFLVRFESKLRKMERELKKVEFQMIGKSGLASKISLEAFSTDLDTACFIAYYVARCNLRSEFTISGQQKPFDQIAKMLFDRCQANATTNWFAIAQVFPHKEVLDHLTEVEKGELMGRWYGVLFDVATLLKDVWETSNINRQTMIVRRGNDSTTWNNTANAWNTARDHWIALLYAMGMQDALEAVCFGKVMRLMAADVAAWHRMSGGGLDPSTFVWNEVPLPWEVLQDEVSCNRTTIERACKKHGLDAYKSGWLAPRPQKVQKFKPTPELVHGVTVGNPFLAKILKKQGFFSGKALKGSFSPDLN